MPRKRKEIQLTKPERGALETFVARGKKSARSITRARILLLLDEGRKDKELTEILGISRGTLHNLRRKYETQEHEHILDLLEEAPRSGRPIEFDSKVEAKVALIACSDPPEGSGRWTLQMIADKLVKLEITDSISYESVRRLLKKTG
jgi:transposase